MNAPPLETPRLLLQPLSGESAPMYEAFYTDASASREYGGPISAAAAQARLASDISAWHQRGFGVWAIRRKQENDLVGVCGFWQSNGWPRELTWWLLPAARGHGIAKEASCAAVEHAYRHFRWSTVETYMNDANSAARALVLRLGGVKTERRLFPDGLERDIYRIPIQNVD
jgi:[ribosomal protein S5]-alanine N-acetyltransferase